MVEGRLEKGETSAATNAFKICRMDSCSYSLIRRRRVGLLVVCVTCSMFLPLTERRHFYYDLLQEKIAEIAVTLKPQSNACCYNGIRCNVSHRREDIYRIIVSHGERKDKHLSWMYAPVRETLLQGFKSREKECGYETLVYVPENASLNGKYTIYPRKGDVIIHIGNAWGREFAHQCLQEFAANEIYCIHYFLEPGIWPYLWNAWSTICEVWTYTHGNMENLVQWEKGFGRLAFEKSAPLVRFVPPGFLNKSQAAPRTYNVSKLSWIFTGFKSKSRAGCWQHLKTLFKGRMYNKVWNEDQWNKLLETKNLLFFNFHQACNKSLPREQKPLETIRVSQSLNSGVLLVSEDVNDIDAGLYEGIVLFEENMWLDYANWSFHLRELLNSSAKLSAYSARAFDLFKMRFSPRQIMDDAKVWDGGYSATCGKNWLLRCKRSRKKTRKDVPTHNVTWRCQFWRGFCHGAAEFLPLSCRLQKQ